MSTSATNSWIQPKACAFAIRDERYVDVMHAYVELMDFTGLGVDEGIRLFLAGFRLPGEAQKIDRMMEAFAARFCGNNPGSFENCDACFVLS